MKLGSGFLNLVIPREGKISTSTPYHNNGKYKPYWEGSLLKTRIKDIIIYMSGGFQTYPDKPTGLS